MLMNKKSPSERPICSRFRGENERLVVKFEPETVASQILSREAYSLEYVFQGSFSRLIMERAIG